MIDAAGMGKTTHARITGAAQIGPEQNKKQGNTKIQDCHRRQLLFVLTFNARMEDPKTEPIGVVVDVGEIVDVQHHLRLHSGPHFLNLEEEPTHFTEPRNSLSGFCDWVLCFFGCQKEIGPAVMTQVHIERKHGTKKKKFGFLFSFFYSLFPLSLSVMDELEI